MNDVPARRPGSLALVLPAAALLAVAAGPVSAQQEDGCALLCPPELTVEPGVSVGPIFGSPRLAELDENGAVVDTVREGTGAAFELAFSLGVPTEIPRTELGLDVVWTPFAGTDRNPLTGYTAAELDDGPVRENLVTFSAEASVALLTAGETGGWLEAAFVVADELGPAARPGDRSAYTHKLSFGLDVAVGALGFLPEGSWLRSLELEGSLGYVATGLPRAGDEVPKGEQRYLDDASPWGASFALVVPVAPASP